MNLFDHQLEKNIRAYVARAKRDGTVAIGRDCIFACVKPPGDCPDAPKGGNLRLAVSATV